MRVFVLAVTVAVGCGSFGASPADSGATAPDGGAVAPAGDAGTGGDDAATKTFVCPLAAFCDDFERDGAAADRWSSSETTGGALAISNARSTSGTRSLHVTLPAPATSDDRYVFLARKVTSSMQASIAFSIYVESSLTTDVVVAEMATTTGHALAVLRGQNLVAFGQSKPDNVAGAEASRPLSFGAWHQVIVSVTMGSTPPQLMLEVDGTPKSTALIEGAGAVDEMQIGATFARGGDAASYFIDDVAILGTP